MSAVVARIISGGQTGADQAGLAAARRCGIATGGTAPRGFLTEDGPQPERLRGFGLAEHPLRSYPARTAANVENSDVTLILAAKLDRGSALTAALCRRARRPCRVVSALTPRAVEGTVSWLQMQRAALDRPLILNIAGNRESREPGIGARATEFLIEVLSMLD